MNQKYLISFQKFIKTCNERIASSKIYKEKKTPTKYSCLRLMNLSWVKSETPIKYIACRESNCPIFANLKKIYKIDSMSLYTTNKNSDQI